MKRSIKITVTLLLSILISSIFTVLAFTNLFSIIEAGIYYPNLKADAEKDVSKFKEAIASYHASSLPRFSDLARKDFMWQAYLVNQGRDLIYKRSNALSVFLKEFPQVESVRLVDPSGKRINFSTLDTDVESQNDFQKIYKNLDKADPFIAGDKISVKIGEPTRIVWDGNKQRIVYCFPVVDSENAYKGSALFAVKVADLEKYFVVKAGLVFRDVLVIGLDGLLIDISGNITNIVDKEAVTKLEDSLSEVWKDTSSSLKSDVMRIGKEGGPSIIYSLKMPQGGNLGVMFPVSRFEMGAADKIIILSVFYLTVFLLVFLVINIKQDPLMMVAERMHRFQVEFLREFFEKKDQLDVMRWQKEIDQRREEIKLYMKRGIKKLSEIKEKEIDTYIVDSWNEVVSIIKSKIEKPPEEKTDMARIEALLRKVLEEGKIVIAAQPRIIDQKAGVTDTIDHKPVKVEEIQEVEELEEIAPAEEAEAVEELEEIEAEPAEEIEEIPRAEEVKVAYEEMENIEELEEIESAEDVETLEEVEEIKDQEEVQTPAGKQEVFQETGKRNKHIVETIRDDMGKIGSIEVVESYTRQVVKESRGEKTGPDFAEMKNLDEIEKLEIVPEIKELPPLPVEKLEELPLVEEAVNKDDTTSAVYEEFLSLVRTEKIQFISITDAIKSIEKEKTNIVLENGVYIIKDELYKGKKTDGKQKGLKAIAELILEGKKETNEGLSGIDQLYGSGELLEESEKKIMQERVSARKQELPLVKKIPLTPKGIDFDRYMSAFAYQITDKVMIYSIGELIKRAKAVSAALFTEDEGMKVSLAIGLTNKSTALFHFSPQEPFYSLCFKERKIVLVIDVFQQIKLFTQRLSSDDVKFIKSAIFLPAIIENKESFLFLGFPGSENIKNLASVFDYLDVYLPS